MFRAFFQILTVSVLGAGVTCARASWLTFASPEFDEIESKLYIGNTKAACDPKLVENLKISHILTIDSKPVSKRTLFNQMNMTNLYIRAENSPEEQIDAYIPTTNAFIAEGLSKGGILVHSRDGRSRAAALVVAFYMERRGLSYVEALEHVKSRRHSVKLNPGFEEQLKAYRPSDRTSQIVFESFCDTFLCFGCSYFVYVWGVIIVAVLLSVAT